MLAVGLDAGTGFTKISTNGRTAIFPSLYGCIYAAPPKMDDLTKSAKKVLVEAVGKKAIKIGKNRNGILIRPIKYGVPYDDHGFVMLAREALERVGIDNPAESTIIIGITYDARMHHRAIKRIIDSKIKPHYCRIAPQAYGTLKSCGKHEGMVINIGHGTTEIMHMGSSSMEGMSIDRASEFVTRQLAKTSVRDAYTNYKKLFEENESLTAKFVDMLAKYIADEVTRMDVPDEIVLSGGGSQIPGMKSSLETALGRTLMVPDDPVFSNARGLEMMAAEHIKKSVSEPRPGSII